MSKVSGKRATLTGWALASFSAGHTVLYDRPAVKGIQTIIQLEVALSFTKTVVRLACPATLRDSALPVTHSFTYYFNGIINILFITYGMNNAFEQAYDAYVVRKQLARQLQWLQLRHDWLTPRSHPGVPAAIATPIPPLKELKPHRATR